MPPLTSLQIKLEETQAQLQQAQEELIELRRQLADTVPAQGGYYETCPVYTAKQYDVAIERAEALAKKGQQLREELEEVGNHAVGIVWDDTLLAEWDALKAPAEALAQRGEGDA